MLNSCYCLEYSSLAVICRCLTNTSLSSTALTSSFAWFLWGFFWQPLRSKNTLSASVQIPVTCKPGLYPRYLEGAVCGAAAAEMIQGYGEHFGSCGCLCPFVRASVAAQVTSIHQVDKRKKKIGWGKAAPLSQEHEHPRLLLGKGKVWIHPSGPQPCFGWFSPSLPLSSLLRRPAMSLAEPLCGLSSPKCICPVVWRPFASMSGGFGHDKKVCAKFSVKSKKCKKSGLTSGSLTWACSKSRCLFAIEWYNIYPATARLPSHVAWQSDMHVDYSLAYLERHTYQASCLPTFVIILI